MRSVRCTSLCAGPAQFGMEPTMTPTSKACSASSKNCMLSRPSTDRWSLAGPRAVVLLDMKTYRLYVFMPDPIRGCFIVQHPLLLRALLFCQGPLTFRRGPCPLRPRHVDFSAKKLPFRLRLLPLTKRKRKLRSKDLPLPMTSVFSKTFLENQALSDLSSQNQ